MKFYCCSSKYEGVSTFSIHYTWVLFYPWRMEKVKKGVVLGPVCLWIMGPHSTAPKKGTSHGNEVLPQDATHLIQRPHYQRISPCQDPAGNRSTQRPPDHHKETQTAVVWTRLLFIRSGQNLLARHSERGKKTRQTEEEVGRQHHGMDRPGVRQVPEGSGQQRKMEETCCEICGAVTLMVKGLMMMMLGKGHLHKNILKLKS